MTGTAPSSIGSPRVSCIIIFLDEEPYLAEAIESVRAQTFHDLELLLVDDGSNDRSAAIAQRFAAASDGRIRYLTHPDLANRGMSASRNLGLLHARGDYVAFLDGDDVWLPGKLAHQLEMFERQPRAQMVCGATEYWHSWAGEDGAAGSDRIVPVGELPSGRTIPQNSLFEPPQLLRLLYPLGKGASPSTSGFMVRRSLVSAVGGFVDRFTGLYEDQAFKIKVYRAAPVYVSSKVYDRYRQHPQSTVAMGDTGGRRDRARLDYLLWLEDHLAKADVPADRRSRLLLSRALLRFRRPRLHALWMRFKRLRGR